MSEFEGNRFLSVRSEEGAFDLLEQALQGAIAPEMALVVFDGWPTLDIYLPATPVKGSISPTMMEAFIELQSALFRANSLVAFDNWDLRGLTREEKERLEFRVKVTDGSSGYLAGLDHALEVIGINAINKMTPEEVVISIVGLAILVTGTVSFKAWLTFKLDQRKADATSKEKSEWLDLQ